MSSDHYVIALDVGGSSVKSGIVSGKGEVAHVTFTRVNSQSSAEVILGSFIQIIDDHLASLSSSRGAMPGGITFGFPGPFEYDEGICRIKGLAKYESLYGVNIKTYLNDRYSSKFHLLFRNDAEAAIIGEAKFGSGRSYRKLIGITLGTGIGSAFLDNGSVLKEGRGIPMGGKLHPVYYKGACADDLFSTRGLLKRLKESALSCATPAEACTEALKGDEECLAVYRNFAADLSEFLNPFIADFHAEAVLVLGGIAGAFPLFRDIFKEVLTVPAIAGTLGTKAALLGAAELFFGIRGT
ncbi:MAG: ROK family protein [Spirochaetales bacterium]|jgi:glucokinase|nr:ROK family protein [Spirochaetales bacterium]